MNTAIRRRDFLRGIAAAGIAVGGISAITACGAAGGKNGRLQVWGQESFSTPGDKLLSQQIHDWGSKNGYSIEYSQLGTENYATKVATAVQAKGLPDVVMLLESDPVYYGSQGHVLDLSDLYGELSKSGGGFFTHALPYVQGGGKIYGIPMEENVAVFCGRLDLIASVTGQRQLPATWDEMEAVSRKIIKPPHLYGIAMPLGLDSEATLRITELVHADGGYYVNAKGEPEVDNPGTIAALTRLQRWWKDGIIPPDAPTSNGSWNNEVYQSRRAAFVENAPSIISWMQSNDPDLERNTGVGLSPTGLRGRAQNAYPWNWSVSSASAHPDAAKDLIRTLMQPSTVEQVYEKVGGRFYPVYQDLPNDPWWKKQSVYDAFPAIVSNDVPPWAPAPSSARVIQPVSSFMGSNIPAAMVQSVTIGKSTPEAAAKSGQQKLEQLFAKA